MVAGSLNLNDITLQQDNVPFILLQPLPFLIMITATLAELSRRPFDIPIGESELVGGPWVEYSGIRWSIIFALTEYAGMWGMAVLTSLIFLGGWEFPFGTSTFWGDFDFLYQLVLVMAKSSFLILTLMWISASFPRLRIDQLMSFCWKILLPFGFLQIMINGIVLVYEPPETVRDILLFATSGALTVAMAYTIYLATKQPSREERVAALVAARSAR
jgi:NADH-quinone oxidoreductase subunit H